MAGEVGMTAATDGVLVCTGCVLVMRISSSVYPVAHMNFPGIRGQTFGTGSRMIGKGPGVVKRDLALRKG